MRLLRYEFLTCCVAFAAGLGCEASAASLPFTYTATIASNNLSYTYFGDGSGTVNPTAIAGVQSGSANPAPSLVPADDPVGGFTFTYSGGSFPSNGYFVQGTVDVLVTVTIGSHSGSFTLEEDYGNLAAVNTVPPLPTLIITGASQLIGSQLITLNATSIGTNRNVSGTAILVGFEYAAVPEPGSLTVASVGGLCLLVMAIRRRLRAA